MAANLSNFRRLLRQYKLISDDTRVHDKFQVIGIYSYTADSNFLKTLTPPLEGSKEVIYLYDVLLTDSQKKLKCFLAYPLGHWIQKNVLKIGCYVQIEKAKLCYLEGEYNDNHIVQYVFLEKLKITENAAVNFPNLDALTYVDSTNYRETEPVPLVTGRKSYMYPWVPVYPLGDNWLDPNPLELNPNDPLPQNFFPLRDVAEDWQRMPKPYPALLVRVLARGMNYYFGYNTNDKLYPFRGSLIIGDSSSTCACISFGRINVGLYYNIQPGQILLIDNYSISRPFQPMLPRLRGQASQLPTQDIEIIIGDMSFVKVLPPNHPTLMMQIALLPPLEFSFADRASLDLAADESSVDIVGVITYVSLIHRFLYKYGKVYACFYVELVDSSSHLPFVVKLYDNGLRFPVSDLHPGRCLVATHLKVMHLPDQMLSSYNIRTYLKATHFTELFTAHSLTSPYIHSNAVSAVNNISRDHPQEVNFLVSHVLRAGGHPTFLRGYRDLEAYKESFGHSLHGKMIPGANWSRALSSLIHRERRCVTLGGFITQIDYVDLSTVDATSPAYGWHYARTVRSRRTHYVNVKARFRLAEGPVNGRLGEREFWPMKYALQQDERFKGFRKFPSTKAEDWEPDGGGVEDLPIHADGYFILTIASLHYQASLQCIFIPEPSEAPHPSFVDALSGNFQALELRQVGRSFTSEPPKYTWDEVQEISRTASEVHDRTFVFAMQFHKPKPDTVQAHLVRAYICPPDQIAEAMAADIIRV